MLKRITQLFYLGDDAASEAEVIEGIVRGVNFRGAKLWILIIAIFVASLGLNTNSTAVIIGAMLISPLMGPIIGMGLAAGIYDFDLLRRSWRNFIVATLFSVLTAMFYFLITPLTEAQSELLARTSPTIYDVLIALSGGLAGIIALSSRSQRAGNVIPGVAIATALMPPLCTVGYGLATANWAYAAGAFYLFAINTIFISFSTLIGTRFIMKFEKKAYIDQKRELRVKRVIYAIVLVTIVPAIVLTVGMVHQNTFERRVNSFIRHEMHFPLTQVISHRVNYDERNFCVVLIGQEIDSVALQTARERLPLYNLDAVGMEVIQGSQSTEDESMNEMLLADSRELHQAQTVIAQQQMLVAELEQRLQLYESTTDLAPQLLRELHVLFPQVRSVTVARGATAQADTLNSQLLAYVVLQQAMSSVEQQRLSDWLHQRASDDLLIVYDGGR